MAPACLRIKFTPLLKNVKKNDSKCYLEIVPEVTCIQNLDKIEWHQDSDLIEYTIPMTYKVILRKRQKISETKDELDLEKIYHSCVDLLPSPLLSCINLASGYITRIISDTIMLDKLTVDYHANDYTKIVKDNFKIIDKIEEEYPKENSNLPNAYKLDQLSDNDLIILNGDRKNSITKINATTSLSNTNAKVKGIDKVLNSFICEDNPQQRKSTETESETISHDIRIREELIRKLSFAPICSIETNERPIHNKYQLIPWNCIYNQTIFQPQKVVTGLVKIKDFHVAHNTNILSKSLKICKIKYFESDNRKKCRYFDRERPEERVAKFIKTMETEILPLKIMLNDILRKCSSLGLINNTKNIQNVYSKYLDKQLLKQCKTEKQIKYNRVVYSIVFDG